VQYLLNHDYAFHMHDNGNYQKFTKKNMLPSATITLIKNFHTNYFMSKMQLPKIKEKKIIRYPRHHWVELLFYF
jgi:hypothetical protein